MKTVQEWLKDLDRGKLLDVYASRHPLHATDTGGGNRSYPERLTAQRAALNRAIDEMISLRPRERSDYVFFAVEQYGAFGSVIGVAMCKAEDIRIQKDPSGRNWMLAPWEELVACPVVETGLTVEHLYDLLADILYAMTMYGYSRADVARKRMELDTALPVGKEDFLNERTLPWEDWDVLFPPPCRERDTVRKRLVWETALRFDRYCFSQAAKEARELLFPEDNQ